MLLRKATSDDLGFVLETFLRSVRQACTHVEDLDNDSVVRLMSNLLANGWTASVVDHERLIAWVVHSEGNRVAWAFVRPEHRGEGVARWMLGEIGINTRRPIYAVFVPNKGNDRRLKLLHRPYECVLRP